MLIAHRIALQPNNKQTTYFAKAAGVARFAYNWALAEWQRQYEAWKADHTLPKPSPFTLRRQLNAIKREQFPWMLDVTKNAPQMAIIQLGKAFEHCFAGRGRYPKFRKKGVHDRFTLTNDQFRVEGSRIRIPSLGWVRMRESLRFSGKIMTLDGRNRARAEGTQGVAATFAAAFPQSESQAERIRQPAKSSGESSSIACSYW